MPRLAGSSEGGRISDFVEGLGPGQLVGRQVLASPSLGDIQLSLSDRRGNIEVEVIRARGLVSKTGSKVSANVSRKASCSGLDTLMLNARFLGF